MYGLHGLSSADTADFWAECVWWRLQEEGYWSPPLGKAVPDLCGGYSCTNNRRGSLHKFYSRPAWQGSGWLKKLSFTSHNCPMDRERPSSANKFINSEWKRIRTKGFINQNYFRSPPLRFRDTLAEREERSFFDSHVPAAVSASRRCTGEIEFPTYNFSTEVPRWKGK